MTLKRRIIKVIKLNNISVADTSDLHLELTDTARLSSLERVNKYRLDEINKIKEYFDNEIKKRKGIIKKLNKYLVSFYYLDKIFIALSASL